MSITIRRAGPEDAAALRDLHAMPMPRRAPCTFPSPPLQQWEQKLTPGWHLQPAGGARGGGGALVPDGGSPPPPPRGEHRHGGTR